MKLTEKQLRKMIYECACEAMKDMEMPPMHHGGVKVVSLKALPEPEHIHSTLFPGLESEEHGHHGFDHDDQGEKSMIVGNLHKMADRASELAQLAKEVPDNEEWVQEKIAVASAMIDSIYNYMKYSRGE
jgi:siderophore synthetase component